MAGTASRLKVGLLLAAFSLFGIGHARADLELSLIGVTFADGSTASGVIDLNVYGYVESGSIVTTAGTSAGGAPMTGYTYPGVGVLVPNLPAFDSIFVFNSTADAFTLVLDVRNALTPNYQGADPLVAGSGIGAQYPSGSTETCQESSGACGAPSQYDGRAIISGELYVPEPGTLTVLGLGVVVILLLRRHRSGSLAQAAA